MLSWLSNAVENITSWVGSGVASLIEWLLQGLDTLATKIIDASNGLWDVFDSLWNFAVGFKDSLVKLLTVFFPFLPAPVALTIGLGLFAAMIAGIIKVVKRK